MDGHIPVLTAEVLRHLQPERGGLFVDCTIGLGGHSRALLEGGATRIIGLDRDEEALALAREALAAWSDRIERQRIFVAIEAEDARRAAFEERA